MIFLSKLFDRLKMLEQVQRYLNNAVSITTEKTSNEMMYEFISLQIIDLLKSFAIDQIIDSQLHINTLIFFVLIAKTFFKNHVKQNVANSIAFT